MSYGKKKIVAISKIGNYFRFGTIIKLSTVEWLNNLKVNPILGNMSNSLPSCDIETSIITHRVYQRGLL